MENKLYFFEDEIEKFKWVLESENPLEQANKVIKEEVENGQDACQKIENYSKSIGYEISTYRISPLIHSSITSKIADRIGFWGNDRRPFEYLSIMKREFQRIFKFHMLSNLEFKKDYKIKVKDLYNEYNISYFREYEIVEKFANGNFVVKLSERNYNKFKEIVEIAKQINDKLSEV